MTPLLLVVVVALVMAGIAIGAIGTISAYGQTNEPTYQTYENETANVRIKYPTNWMAESKNVQWPMIVRIFPNEFMSEQYPSVVLNVYYRDKITTTEHATIPIPENNITELADYFLTAIEAEPDARLINFTSNANVTLFNETTTIPGFVSHFYEFGFLSESQVMAIGTILNDKDVILFEYKAEQESFDKYLPEVKKMIDSFQLLS